MFLLILAVNQNVIQIGIAAGEAKWNLWKVWPAVFKPKGMRVNSANPNGMITAVLRM